MNIERDEFLTRQMGECWHEEFEEYNYHGELRSRCKCGETALKEYCCIRSSGFTQKYDFSTGDAFIKLWNWVRVQPWLDNFLYEYWSCPKGRLVFPYLYIDPDKFADAVFNYLSGVFPSFFFEWKERYEKEIK